MSQPRALSPWVSGVVAVEGGGDHGRGLQTWLLLESRGWLVGLVYGTSGSLAESGYQAITGLGPRNLHCHKKQKMPRCAIEFKKARLSVLVHTKGPRRTLFAHELCDLGLVLGHRGALHPPVTEGHYLPQQLLRP